jgi:hypothetical protein
MTSALVAGVLRASKVWGIREVAELLELNRNVDECRSWY